MAALIVDCNWARLSSPLRGMPLAKYTSAFFSFSEASIFTADSSAESRLGLETDDHVGVGLRQVNPGGARVPALWVWSWPRAWLRSSPGARHCRPCGDPPGPSRGRAWSHEPVDTPPGRPRATRTYAGPNRRGYSRQRPAQWKLQ